MTISLTLASHDLNGVHTLMIMGWEGAHRIETTRGNWVEIAALQRYDGEFWTFQSVGIDGVLRCFTSLRGPRRTTRSDLPMVIKLPRGMKKKITIKFVR